MDKASKVIRNNLPESTGGSLRLQPAYITRTTRQPINRAAAIRQSRSRFYSTRAGARYGSGRPFQGSRIHAAVTRITSTTPFTSTLRPNLTGGTLGRTAGGYAVGAGRTGGARYFSHSPASPAEVINNVSIGVRTFWLSGQKARFDGIDPRTGEKRYKAVSTLQYEAERKMYPNDAPGSYIDFQLSPTITAFGSFGTLGKSSTESAETHTLKSEGVMKMLSVDLARALKDFAAVLNDLNRLSSLGDLPISLHDKSTLRVRFPGCDIDTVESLCDEVGVQRGYIQQDEDFDACNGAEIALLFPFAPSRVSPSEDDVPIYFESHMKGRAPEVVDWHNMISPEISSQLHSSGKEASHTGLDFDHVDQNPWATSPSGYSSLDISELGDRVFFPDLSDKHTYSAYEGVEGIHRFLQECDRAAR